MRGRYVALAILALGAGGAAGVAVERFHLSAPTTAEISGPKVLYWVAPMDPNYRRQEPGKSPMGMDLIPVYEGQEPSGNPGEVKLSATEINAIGVRTAIARVEPLAHRIETVGFVGYDEHATSHVHMRVEGWIEQLSVRAVGDTVSKGDLLFSLYAPEITVASFELLRGTQRNDQKEIEIARRKLRNFGVTPRQIEEMAESDEPAEHIRVYAPQNGVVIALAGAEGMYLEPDTRAMTLTDLTTVWLLVDVFERDIGRVLPNMRALARFEHLPGKTFEGEIDYVYPELDPETRTLPVRLRFDNREGLLRPNMFGTVSLIPNHTRQAVTVPSEAVIRTGRAERVILKTGDGTFRPRLVTTGLRDSFGNGARTEIVQGLSPGEEIVASAQFLIDSESALNAGLMRMAPTEGEPARGTGMLVAYDPERRQATVRHDPIEALDWPAMETSFAVRADVRLDRMAEGDAVEFSAVRGADGLLALIDLRPEDGIAATGTGIVQAVTPDGKLTLSHDPIPELGWPAMKMDMTVAGFDPKEVPLETPVSFDLAKGADGLFTIVAVRAEGTSSPEAKTRPSEAAPPIVVDGRIEAVDAATRMAKITHGAIAEIGMPGMTMDFALADTLDPGALPVGTDLRLTFARPDGITMVLEAAETAAPTYTVDGTINSIDPASRTANVTHGPLTEIGMPGMTMDFPLGPGIDPATLQAGEATLKLGLDEAGQLILKSAEPKSAQSRPLGLGDDAHRTTRVAGSGDGEEATR